jgi:long-chain acyl-CoA synthetase
VSAPARPSTGSRTVADLLPRAAERFADHVAIRAKRDGTWQDMTVAQLAERATAIGRALIALGVQPGDRVALLSATRPEWTIVALGIAMTGAVIVPIYPTSACEECTWLIGDSGAVAVVGAGADEVARLTSAVAGLPDVRHILSIEPVGGVPAIGDVDSSAVPREALAQRWSAVAPQDAFTFVYTSGTTGPPKGCVHTHGGYRAALDTIRARDALHGADDLLYLFLPLAHVFALMIQMAALDTGTPVAYFGGDARRIVPELAEVRPTFLPSVPRIFEKLYAAVTADLAPEQVADATRIGLRARDLHQAGQPLPDGLCQAFERLDATLFQRVRGIFGGRLREAASGAAPIAHEILEFFYAAGVPVMEGWGLTETAVAVTTSSPAQHRFGTVGRAVPGVELRIADDGEILVSGPNLFARYHDDPVATAAALRDGWLHTGDLGALDADGFLTITGRKKDIIITAGGKNLTPANIENDMQQCRWVSHAVMHGDARPYPVMLVTLDAEQLVPWARAAGLPNDLPTLARHPAVRALLEEHLAAVNARYASAAQVKKLAILDRDLSPETGELTATLKVRRAVVNDRFRAVFDALYAEG